MDQTSPMLLNELHFSTGPPERAALFHPASHLHPAAMRARGCAGWPQTGSLAVTTGQLGEHDEMHSGKDYLLDCLEGGLISEEPLG
jgi:hypothetical protein